jgi:hypothetical protein
MLDMQAQRLVVMIYRSGRQLASLETKGVQVLRANSRRGVRG